MIVQIMGAGALGSLIGYLIQKAGYDVLFIARRKQHEALKAGLRISGIVNDAIQVKVYNSPKDADLTFLTVKAYDTEEAVKKLAEVNCGIVCSLQNGLKIDEIMKKYLNKPVRGITTYAAYLVEWGHVFFAAEGEIIIGDLNKNKYSKKVLEVLKASNIKAWIVEDIKEKVWEKTIINAVINPLTALCRVRNGEILKRRELWDIAKEITHECKITAEKTGIKVEKIEEKIKKVIMKTSENKSSMLQDLERGRRTEIDFINGAIVEIAKKFGIHTPINNLIVKLIKGAESRK